MILGNDLVQEKSRKVRKMKKFLDFVREHEGKHYSVLSDFQHKPCPMFGSKELGLVNPNVITIAAGLYVPTYPYALTDSGTAAMTGITIPYEGFTGEIGLLPGGAFTWTTATNIAVAGTAVAAKLLKFFYNPVNSKWYPSYVA